MIALRCLFPTGRYHATPWGRHVNEAALAWPPEPMRVLRALIACHHRKADKDVFSDDALADLIDALAEELPIYRLPEAVHGHTRHYMPSPVKTTLIFDAFACLDRTEPLVIGWPGVVFNQKQLAHLEHLASRLGYLGRAESWVEAAMTEWDGQGANALPLRSGNGRHGAEGPDCRVVRLYAPLSPTAYEETRGHLVRNERERRSASLANKLKPAEKVLDNDMKEFLATLPERLADALTIDTSELQTAGWSDPPAIRRVLYSGPELGATWHGQRRQQVVHKRSNPTVARFVLAGRPRPRVEDTVRIAEIMRLAAMAKFGWGIVEGKRRPNAPSVISGYGDDGEPMHSDSHAHAFWLPEDADGDGEIDHVVVYAAAGLNGECRLGLDRITRLWIEKGGRTGDEEEEASAGGRAEWRLALEGFGHPGDFASASSLLGCSGRWLSATPYLTPWYAKKRFQWKDQIARELRERGISEVCEASNECRSLTINGRDRRPIHFHRFRSRRGLRQPDTLGRFVELTFDHPVQGPLALGFGCHFGLGLFAAK